MKFVACFKRIAGLAGTGGPYMQIICVIFNVGLLIILSCFSHILMNSTWHIFTMAI